MSKTIEVLMEEFFAAYDKGHGADYIENLKEPDKSTLLDRLCQEVEIELKMPSGDNDSFSEN